MVFIYKFAPYVPEKTKESFIWIKATLEFVYKKWFHGINNLRLSFFFFRYNFNSLLHIIQNLNETNVTTIIFIGVPSIIKYSDDAIKFGLIEKHSVYSEYWPCELVLYRTATGSKCLFKYVLKYANLYQYILMSVEYQIQ